MIRVLEAEGEEGHSTRCARLRAPREEVLPPLLLPENAVDPGERDPKGRSVLENVFQGKGSRARAHDPCELLQPATGGRVTEYQMRIGKEPPQEKLPARQEQHTRSRAEVTAEPVESSQSLRGDGKNQRAPFESLLGAGRFEREPQGRERGEIFFAPVFDPGCRFRHLEQLVPPFGDI